MSSDAITLGDFLVEALSLLFVFCLVGVLPLLSMQTHFKKFSAKRKSLRDDSLPHKTNRGLSFFEKLAYPVWFIRKEIYFRSDEFKQKRDTLQRVVEDHNDVAEYVWELRSNGVFDFGSSDTGKYAHLAESRNTSAFDYKRDRHVVTDDPNTHQCSLQVVTRAKQEPLKYLVKYFEFTPDKETLARLETVSESMDRLGEALVNLRERESDLAQAMRPPTFIRKHFIPEFLSKMNADFDDIHVPFEEYRFEYVSAGGNSSQVTSILMTQEVVDELIKLISSKIKLRATAAGQRALMTRGLREKIKRRDNYTCQQCHVSVRDEPHLLLEVDHIHPVSKGGLTVESNLQTLCWKCNRSKSNKVPLHNFL